MGNDTNVYQEPAGIRCDELRIALWQLSEAADKAMEDGDRKDAIFTGFGKVFEFLELWQADPKMQLEPEMIADYSDKVEQVRREARRILDRKSASYGSGAHGVADTWRKECIDGIIEMGMKPPEGFIEPEEGEPGDG